MSLINFKEIPAANSGEGQQDTFELFARDFLQKNGFEIIVPPGRGADGGSDLLVAEKRRGIVGETIVKWLVSCKHFAHSGKSVGLSDEDSILDRLKAHGAQGFIGFYSTLASSSLIERVKKFDGYEYKMYDSRLIEDYLINSEVGNRLFTRYFPESHRLWRRGSPRRPDLGFKNDVLKCQHCGKSLVDESTVELSMVVCLEDIKNKKINKIYWCCKGVCDYYLKAKFKNDSTTEYRWDELYTYVHPSGFIVKMCYLFAELNQGKRFTQSAEREMFDFMTSLFHQVSRELTPDEIDRYKNGLVELL